MRKTFTLAVAGVALAGCGMLPGVTGSGGAEKQVVTQSTPAESGPETSAPAEQRTAPPQGDQVIATREAKVQGSDGATRVRVEVTALLRQGKTVTLNWTLTTLEGKFALHNGLGRGVLDFTVSGVSLVDPVNAKRYRVARNGTDANAKCVCSGTQGEFLEKDESASLYAVFAAPPADVTKVNIEMPTIGMLIDVPIS